MANTRYPFTRSPKGWYMVAFSDELQPGDLKPVTYFEQDLVLYRDHDGEVHLLHAYCPHMGAHLASGEVHGGVRIKDGNIVCPFHQWEFNGKGECVSIPYAEKIPPKAKIPCWHVVEKNKMIMAWHNIEGGEPEWELPDIPEVFSDEWTDYEVREWIIRTHNLDMAENQVDVAHFQYLHGTQDYPRSEAEVDGHIMRVVSKAGMGTPRGQVQGGIESTSYGFGFSTIRFTGIVDTMLVTSTTPIDGEYVHTRFCFMVKKTGGADVTKGVGKAFIREVSRQLEEDIPVWENKVFVHPPVLCEGDGPVGLFRKWIKQFFPAGTFDKLNVQAASYGHQEPAGPRPGEPKDVAPQQQASAG